jgi:hypothetical protein
MKGFSVLGLRPHVVIRGSEGMQLAGKKSADKSSLHTIAIGNRRDVQIT